MDTVAPFITWADARDDMRAILDRFVAGGMNRYEAVNALRNCVDWFAAEAYKEQKAIRK
jgi:hypothetical protein